MYKQCVTEESIRRQQQMTQSLLDLMGATSYSRITVADICGRVGLSRKSFYRYFDSKDDCLYALLDQVIQDFTRFYPQAYTTTRPSEEYLERYFSYWQQQSPLLEALNRNQLTSLLYERTLLSTALEKQLRQSQNSENDFEQLLFMVCGTTGLIIAWHMDGYRKTAAQMAASVERLIGISETKR